MKSAAYTHPHHSAGGFGAVALEQQVVFMLAHDGDHLLQTAEGVARLH